MYIYICIYVYIRIHIHRETQTRFSFSFHTPGFPSFLSLLVLSSFSFSQHLASHSFRRFAVTSDFVSPIDVTANPLSFSFFFVSFFFSWISVAHWVVLFPEPHGWRRWDRIEIRVGGLGFSCIHPRTWCAPMNGCISGVAELVTRYLAPRFSRACTLPMTARFPPLPLS